MTIHIYQGIIRQRICIQMSSATIVIPNKDHTEIRSPIAFATKEYTNFEILIIENNSEDQATLTIMKRKKQMSAYV